MAKSKKVRRKKRKAAARAIETKKLESKIRRGKK